MSKPNGESLVILCPYCGNAQAGGQRCDVCGGLFEPLSRKATQISMGPWYIRDTRNPFRPGCSYEVLKKQAKAGRIKSMTVLRGPTTKQYWSVARNVPGVAHLIGYCHACSEKIGPGATSCPQCGVVFSEPNERNELGLMYPTEAEAQKAQRHLNAAIARSSGDDGDAARADVQTAEAGGARPAAARSIAGAVTTPGPSAPGADLLDEVLGDGGDGGDEPARAPDRKMPVPPVPVGGASQPAETEPVYADLGSFAPLDFTPSDDSESPEDDVTDAAGPTAALDTEFDTLEELSAKNSRLGTMTWVLIGVNAAILLLVGFLFVKLMLNPPAKSSPTGDRANAGVDARPGDDVLPFTYQPPPLDDADVAPIDPPPSPPDPVSPTPPDTADPPDAAEQVRLQAEAAQREHDRMMHNEVVGIVNRAEALRRSEQFADALFLLESIRENYPVKFHPPHLNTWISNVKRVIEGDRNPTFFGVEGK